MADPTKLTATEASARLGVKRQTLYAYVSRGLLDRTVAADGRTSLFDQGQIDGLRRQRRRTDDGEASSVITSSITRIDEAGHSYRGQSVIDLVSSDTDFEAVADLLWDVHLERSANGQEGHNWLLPLDDLAQIRASQGSLDDGAPTLDRLRIVVATMSAGDPLRHDLSPGSVAIVGRRIIAGMIAGLPKIHLGPRDRLADQLWLSLSPDPGSQAQRQALNGALILLADHGLTASTFAVRLASSVRADPYSAVSAGLGAVGGVLHGAAGTAVHELLDRVELYGAETALGRELAANQRIPGVGHTVHHRRDPREEVLLDLLRHGWADDPRLELVLELRALLIERLPSPLNIDFALGALAWLAEMEPSTEAIFAIARTAGWVAHSMEENAEKAGRLEPVSRYVGARLDPDFGRR